VGVNKTILRISAMVKIIVTKAVVKNITALCPPSRRMLRHLQAVRKDGRPDCLRHQPRTAGENRKDPPAISCMKNRGWILFSAAKYFVAKATACFSPAVLSFCSPSTG